MPDPLPITRITIEGELGTGVFEAYHMSISPGLRTGYVVGGRGSTVNAVLGAATGQGSDSKRKGVYIDAGGGAMTWELQFRQWEGSTDKQDDPLQWGDSPDPGVHTKTSATGADAFSKLECLMYWLEQTTIDSDQPAQLEYGQHYAEGVYDPKDVVLEEPRIQQTAEDGSWISGSMTLVSAANLQEILDAVVRTQGE
jgi:hypothetical protein